jgi:hypothetical protein
MHRPDPSTTPAGYATFDGTQTVMPGTYDEPTRQSGPLTPAEESLLSQLRSRSDRPSVAYGHTRVIQPISRKHKTKRAKAGKSLRQRPANREHGTSPKPLNPAILELANNDDLTVATIARQAGKKPGPQPPDNEVVVPLR